MGYGPKSQLKLLDTNCVPRSNKNNISVDPYQIVNAQHQSGMTPVATISNILRENEKQNVLSSLSLMS